MRLLLVMILSFISHSVANACDWGNAKHNIEWVFLDGDAKNDFLKAYNNPSGSLDWIFGNQDKTNGYHNAYRAVLFAQRHNYDSYRSIEACPGEAVKLLRDKGYEAIPD